MPEYDKQCIHWAVSWTIQVSYWLNTLSTVHMWRKEKKANASVCSNAEGIYNNSYFKIKIMYKKCSLVYKNTHKGKEVNQYVPHIQQHIVNYTSCLKTMRLLASTRHYFLTTSFTNTHILKTAVLYLLALLPRMGKTLAKLCDNDSSNYTGGTQWTEDGYTEINSINL